MGASAVILESSEIENAKRSCKTNHLIKNNVDLFEIINNLPFNYNPKYKALLSDEALVFWSPEKGYKIYKNGPLGRKVFEEKCSEDC